MPPHWTMTTRQHMDPLMNWISPLPPSSPMSRLSASKTKSEGILQFINSLNGLSARSVHSPYLPESLVFEYLLILLSSLPGPFGWLPPFYLRQPLVSRENLFY